MKKILSSVIVLVICLSLSAPPALAGSKQRHRWEGVAIGLGAAILGHALVANRHQDRYDRAQVGERSGYYYDPPASRRGSAYCPRPPRRGRGHWKIEKVWVPPTFRKVWNPPHYNRKGRWVAGKWIDIEDRPGHWVKKQVWVGRR